MTTLRPAVAALACLVLAAGCGGWQIRGRAVRGSSGPGLPASDAEERNLPLTEARVTVECPEDSEGASRLRRVELRADMDGRFRGGGEGTLPLDCFVAVEAPGYSRETYRVSEVCATEPSDETAGCASVTVQATLPPAY